MRLGPKYNRIRWWAGAAMMLAGFLLMFVLVRTSEKGALAAGPFYVVGLVLTATAAVGNRRRMQAKLIARNYSWCAKCGYPFDESVDDLQMITCTECGAHVRADLARAWYRDAPERARQIIDL